MATAAAALLFAAALLPTVGVQLEGGLNLTCLVDLPGGILLELNGPCTPPILDSAKHWLCSAVGSRFCTVAEIEVEDSRGTGCQFGSCG